MLTFSVPQLTEQFGVDAVDLLLSLDAIPAAEYGATIGDRRYGPDAVAFLNDRAARIGQHVPAAEAVTESATAVELPTTVAALGAESKYTFRFCEGEVLK
ncbi:MAG: hypothetical protein K8T25_01970 [Planctomycetia bacterium]|nr:hypothetical protein [Planctomycetia bacterium]